MSAPEGLRVKGVEVVAVRPEPADVRRLAYARSLPGGGGGRPKAAAEAPTAPLSGADRYFLVLVRLDEPVPVAAGHVRLFVGSEPIDQYFGFDGGVYFKVFDPAFLQAHAGEPVSVAVAGGPPVKTAATLPASPAKALLALERPLRPAASGGDAAGAIALPTKAEVLRGRHG